LAEGKKMNLWTNIWSNFTQFTNSIDFDKLWNGMSESSVTKVIETTEL
jgi:hypothetical protein